MTKLSLEELVSLAKRRGFVFQGSEIYGGLAGMWDYGPLGALLRKNITNLWWQRFVTNRDDMYGVDTAILMNTKVWEASGHTGAGFTDTLVEDLVTHKRYRADHLLEDNGIANAAELSLKELEAKIKELKLKSPDGNKLSEVRQFNMMFSTQAGAVEDSSSLVYLRPETAQGMFVNFKNVVDTMRPRLPFGIAQIGKSFRNEITPRDFIFRVRELEIMELEYFIRPEDWEKQFEYWMSEMKAWMEQIGLSLKDVHELEVPEADRAHYSRRTVDFEYDFPFGRKELYGLAYRTDYDLRNHSEISGIDLSYQDPETDEKMIPHVIEPTFGVGRTMLAVLASAYTEEKIGDESRIVLKFKPEVAPVKIAVSPLLRNKPELVKLAREVYGQMKAEFGEVMYDDNGNIGKRYRRQDEIGTPLCLTIDFDSLTGKDVTVRNRDTMKQERIKISALNKAIADQLTKFSNGAK